MRGSTQAEFLYAALGYLGELGYDDAEEVLTVDERTKFEGGCNTCSYEYQVLDVRYRTTDGSSREVTVEGSLSEIMKGLLRQRWFAHHPCTVLHWNQHHHRRPP